MQIKNSYRNENHKNSFQNEFQKLVILKIRISKNNSWKQYTFEVVNDAWNFHFFRIDAVIQVACVVSWASIFTCQIMVVADFFICWPEWFDADRAVCGVVVFPPLFLGQLFHRDFISQMFSKDGYCGWDLVQKPFSGVIFYIHLGWFKAFPITPFHADAARTW